MAIDCSSELTEKLQKENKINIFACYQCGKCTAGCPMADDMRHTPNQIIRMVQLGMEDEVLKSNTIWLCASCITCSVRCPREIELAELMDVLRRLAYKRKISPDNDRDVPLFNRVFLKNIEIFGRAYELGLIGVLNILTGKFFKDFSIVPKIFLKNKIRVFPSFSKGAKEIFKNSRKIE